MVFKTEIKHRGWLDAAIQQIEPVEIKVYKHLRKGDSEHVLSQMTETLDIDLLIMGTVGRTGIPGFFIGNTADAILRKVTCSVLTIKPEKFKTPVKPSK